MEYDTNIVTVLELTERRFGYLSRLSLMADGSGSVVYFHRGIQHLFAFNNLSELFEEIHKQVLTIPE